MQMRSKQFMIQPHTHVRKCGDNDPSTGAQWERWAHKGDNLDYITHSIIMDNAYQARITRTGLNIHQQREIQHWEFNSALQKDSFPT